MKNGNNNVIEFTIKTNKKNSKRANNNVNNTDTGIQINELSSQDGCISYPTETEINVMNALVDQYVSKDLNAMVPFNMWNGDCMKTIFNEMSEYAKEIGADPWDAFALFIQKLHGWRMEETEDGGVVVKYGKE